MTTPPPPITEPDPSARVCSSDKAGPCTGCRRTTHRYANGGSPLCQWCMEPVQARWGSSVRFVNTRP
ncbi:hypothetical protein ABZ896_10215 [Streptomyces sp. NPDC047072]|uniref:hypothetical protein n=1 Tax=Streptomyces sp. NPDC047072 TaxID=3154809 RepID=UPI0033EB8026